MSNANDILLLAARILLALMFLVSGFPMIFGAAGFAGYLGSLGMPMPLVVTWLVIALKVLGGIALVIGFQTRLVSWAFIAFCVATAFIGHFPAEMTVFWKNIAVAGGFLALIAAGPGALSVDKR
ncbi:DoxX family protein [Aminobacter sp. J41]|jgi:putative oxidoreductase|uniref:DoxX family protein n=1 Tax=Aminobacter sp. J41 TaxID=935261 RepID=UPI0004B527DC|nr:DoxX family protein [Aminobacter sp. J41]